jgi:hypothetical protein
MRIESDNYASMASQWSGKTETPGERERDGDSDDRVAATKPREQINPYAPDTATRVNILA